MDKIIEINNLNHNNILNNLNLSQHNNSFISISGHNNCGKTTLIRILNRELITDTKILINNKEIKNYSIEEYNSLVQCVIPFEIIFTKNTLEQELDFLNLKKDNLVIKGLNIEKLLKKIFSQLTDKEIILSQLLITLLKQPKILLIDNIDSYFSKQEFIKLLEFIKMYQQKKKITIILTTLNLEYTLLTDKLIILENGTISLEGEPLEVLKQDNKINKLGLDLPFMVDLSSKLIDYELLKDIELDIDRLVNILWNS